MPKSDIIADGDERHEFPGACTFDETSNVMYVPYLHKGRVGFRCIRMDADKDDTFIYFNPSDSTDDGVPNIFVYEGVTGDPCYDGASHHYVIEFPTDAERAEALGEKAEGDA